MRILTKPAGFFKAAAMLVSIGIGLGNPSPAPAQQDSAVLFRNVKIFDGKNGTLSAASNVLVRDRKIERISAADIAATGQVIDGGGRVLMPGLIDAHWHAMLVRPTPMAALGDVGYNNLLAASEATATLMRGFTTIRDMGGPSFGLKRAIDEDLVAGPRIYPSGAIITITGGHGDFRQLSDLPRTIGGMLSRMELIGGSMVADSPGRGPRARARAADAGRLAGQAHRGRRRRFALQSARRVDLHRARAARRRRGRRQLGHLRCHCTPIRRSRSSARSQPASDASSTVTSWTRRAQS